MYTHHVQSTFCTKIASHYEYQLNMYQKTYIKNLQVSGMVGSKVHRLSSIWLNQPQQDAIFPPINLLQLMYRSRGSQKGQQNQAEIH